MSAANDGGLVSPIQSYLDRLHAKYADLNDGAVATYIPELAKADPSWFGICIATADGHLYEAGDTRQPFTIQSISKPFVYGLGIEDRGRDAVLRKIGVEPTGDAFNSISLAPGTGCPLNPMINAGAIAATSLVAGDSAPDKLYRLLAVLGLYAGRQLSVDHPVYVSEKATGHRNRAIGHMLRNFEILTEDPEPALDLYFQQCSISVDCRDLSLMGATLANGGVNPRTGERAVRDDIVDKMLSVMTTCGMYDYAGEWVYWVGMPAKSGVAGGIVAVLPGQFGIGVFSPRLDARGNSVRGVQVCKDLSHDFNLHSLRVPPTLHSAIRGQFDLTEISSKHQRSDTERRRLDKVGKRALVFALQGELGFASLEGVVRRLVAASENIDCAILDWRRVVLIDPSCTTLLVEIAHNMGAAGKRLAFSSTGGHTKIIRLLQEQILTSHFAKLWRVFPDIDHAIEWCEDVLLDKAAMVLTVEKDVALAEHQICTGMSPDRVAQLAPLLQPEEFVRGELIVRRGEVADKLYLLMRGAVSVAIALPNGEQRRLSTIEAGMSFGELAFVDGSVRTADVRAQRATRCCVLTRDAFLHLGTSHPDIKVALLENLFRNAARMVGRLNQEVTTLHE